VASDVAPVRSRGADLLRSRGTVRNGIVLAALDFLLGFFGGLAGSALASARICTRFGGDSEQLSVTFERRAPSTSILFFFMCRTCASKSPAASSIPILARFPMIGEAALDILLLVGEHGESSLFLPTFEGEEGGLGRFDGREITVRPVAPQLKREGSRRLPGEGGIVTVPEGESGRTGVRVRFEGVGLIVGRGTGAFGGVTTSEFCAIRVGSGGRGLLGGGPGNGGVSMERDPARARDQGKEEVVETDDASALDEAEGRKAEGWHDVGMDVVGDGREHVETEPSVSEGTWGDTPIAG